MLFVMRVLNCVAIMLFVSVNKNLSLPTMRNVLHVKFGIQGRRLMLGGANTLPSTVQETLGSRDCTASSHVDGIGTDIDFTEDSMLSLCENVRHHISSLRTEVQFMSEQVQAMTEKVLAINDKLAADQKILLVRQLADALQFSFTRTFPHLFPDVNRSYLTTYKSLCAKVHMHGSLVDKGKLSEIQRSITAAGLDPDTFDDVVGKIGAMCPRIMHPATFEVMGLGSAKSVDAVAMAEVIETAPIRRPRKEVAAMLLSLLVKYQLPGNPLLATTDMRFERDDEDDESV